MQHRCRRPTVSQQAFLFVAAVLLLTLYRSVPPANPQRSPQQEQRSFPPTSSSSSSLSSSSISAQGIDEQDQGRFSSPLSSSSSSSLPLPPPPPPPQAFVPNGDFPISLERDTGGDSVMSQFMAAVDLLKKVAAKETDSNEASKVQSRDSNAGIANKNNKTTLTFDKETESDTVMTNKNKNKTQDSDKETDSDTVMTNKTRNSDKETESDTVMMSKNTNKTQEPESDKTTTNNNKNKTPNKETHPNTASEPHLNVNKAEAKPPNNKSSPSEEQTRASTRPCNVTARPLNACNCTRELHVQGLKHCRGTVPEVLATLNRTLGSSTCGDGATIRGANQKVISISLFGAFPSEYHSGLSEVLLRAQRSYPGWNVRVYHDLDLEEASRKSWACELSCRFPFLDLCAVDRLPGIGDIRPTIGTIWRIAVLGDPLVERFIVRDADSPILQREVDAVNEWLDSGKCFHMMRDNPAHTMPIMGGMFGGCGFWQRELLERLRVTILRFSKKKSHQSYYDQVNEVRFLWPTMKKNLIAHDSYFCKQYPGSQPFPTQRLNRTFVGMRKYREEFHADKVHQPCPVECRPPKHKDWEFC